MFCCAKQPAFKRPAKQQSDLLYLQRGFINNKNEFQLTDLIHFPLHNVFYRNGLHYNIAGYFLHFDAIISAVEEDIGIGILNQVNYENIQKEIKKIKVKGLSLECPYYLVCPKSNSSEPLVKSFIGFCQENFEYVKNRYGDSYDNS